MTGGVAQLFKIALQFFFNKDGNDLSSGVIIYPSCGEPCLVTGYISAITQDERAHKYVLDVLGSGGHKICGKCSNCVNFKSGWLPDSTGFYKPSTSIDLNDFTEYTMEDIRTMQKRLQ